MRIKEIMAAISNRLLSNPFQRDCRKVAEEILCCRKSLQRICRDSESPFMDIGNALESVSNEGGAIAGKILETIGSISSDGGESLLDRMNEMVKVALCDLDSRHHEVSLRLEQISLLIDDLSRLQHSCKTVEKISVSLKGIGFGIRVESAGSESSEALFGVVSQQIGHLSQEISRLTKQIREDARKTGREQEEIFQEVTEEAGRIKGLTREGQQTVETSAQDARKLIAWSISAMEQANTHGREIRRQVGEVVVGMQLHDSMNQRVEHILHALEDVEALCRMGKGRYATVLAIIELQQGQIGQTREEIDGVYQRTQQAFNAIHHEIDGLTQSLSELSNDQNQKPFEALQRDLKNLKELRHQARSATERVRSTALAAAEINRRLTGHMEQVENIGFQTHFLSLNAIIKAAHLGETGRTLEILAQEVTHISQQTGRFVDTVKDILNEVSELAGKMTADVGQAEAEQEAGVSERGLFQLTDIYDRFIRNSDETLHRAQVLKSTIEDVLSGLAFLKSLSHEMLGEIDRLEKLKKIIGKRKPKANFNISSEETRKLADRYTMNQERGVHERLVGGHSTRALPDPQDDLQPPGHKPGQKPDNEEKEGFGDNVELF